jgi:hypothetical protein
MQEKPKVSVTRTRRDSAARDFPFTADSIPTGDLKNIRAQAWDVFTAAAANGLGITRVIRKGKWVTARGGHMADLIDGFVT